MGDADRFNRIVKATGKATVRTVKAFIPNAFLDLPEKLAKKQGERNKAIMDKYYDTVKVTKANEAVLESKLVSLINEREKNEGQIKLLQNKVIALSSSAPRTTRPNSGKPSQSAAARAERAKTKIAGALTKMTESAAIVGRINTEIDTVVANSTLTDKRLAEDMRQNGSITGYTEKQNTLTQRVLPYNKFVKKMYAELHKKFPTDTAPEIMKKIGAEWRKKNNK